MLNGMELRHLNLHLLSGGKDLPTLGEGDDALDVDGGLPGQGGGEARDPRGHPLVGAGYNHASHARCRRLRS